MGPAHRTLNDSGEILFLTTIINAHGDDRGILGGAFGTKGLRSGYKQMPYLHALEVSGGRMLCNQPFNEDVLMRPSERPELDNKADWTNTRPFDFGLYHPPVVTEQLRNQ